MRFILAFASCPLQIKKGGFGCCCSFCCCQIINSDSRLMEALLSYDAAMSVTGVRVHHGRAREYVEGILAQKFSSEVTLVMWFTFLQLR